MGKTASANETSYVLLFASMVGLLAGLGLVVYGWPQPCTGYLPFCPYPLSFYIFVFLGILIVLASVGLMVYSMRNHIQPH